jgi:hypothetical protein
MQTEPITIHVDAAAAQAFKSASDEERRKLEAWLSLRLLEVARSKESLLAVMDEISSSKAQERGLTPEALQSILDEQ